jgi:hypothetical protein
MSSDTLECLQQTDCNNGKDCCETVVVNGGQAPNCTVVSLSSRCESTCKSNLLSACQGTDTLHLCGQPSDCSDDAASPNCCMVGAQYACVGNALAMAGLSCM